MLSLSCQAEEHEDEEKSKQIQSTDEGGRFDVIPKYSERTIVTNPGPAVAGGAVYVVAVPLELQLTLFLLIHGIYGTLSLE